MAAKYISFSISICFISWIIGMIVNAAIKESKFYQQKLSNLNFISNGRLNKMIGMNAFKWIVKNTFFKFFNQKIKVNNKIEAGGLAVLRSEMTISEISHLIAFVFVCGFVIAKFIKGFFVFGLTISVANILMNLYPSLLQQENKRRIDKLIKRFHLSELKQV